MPYSRAQLDFCCQKDEVRAKKDVIVGKGLSDVSISWCPCMRGLWSVGRQHNPLMCFQGLKISSVKMWEARVENANIGLEKGVTCISGNVVGPSTVYNFSYKLLCKLVTTWNIALLDQYVCMCTLAKQRRRCCCDWENIEFHVGKMCYFMVNSWRLRFDGLTLKFWQKPNLFATSLVFFFSQTSTGVHQILTSTHNHDITP